MSQITIYHKNVEARKTCTKRSRFPRIVSTLQELSIPQPSPLAARTSPANTSRTINSVAGQAALSTLLSKLYETRRFGSGNSTNPTFRFNRYERIIIRPIASLYSLVALKESTFAFTLGGVPRHCTIVHPI